MKTWMSGKNFGSLGLVGMIVQLVAVAAHADVRIVARNVSAEARDLYVYAEHLADLKRGNERTAVRRLSDVVDAADRFEREIDEHALVLLERALDRTIQSYSDLRAYYARRLDFDRLEADIRVLRNELFYGTVTPGAPTVTFDKSCESNSNAYKECKTKVLIIDLEVSRQLSQADCIKGLTFGRVGNRIWVDDGCRAEFRVIGAF